MSAVTRRALLRAAAAASVVGSSRVQAHTIGPVKPAAAAPRVALTSARGESQELAAVLRGKVTGVQLMFTRCTALCPMQGALFGGVQKLLTDAPAELQLLSLSIDIGRDTPQTLWAWLAKMGANGDRWTGALPTAATLSALFDFVRGRAEGPDPHTGQVFVFNRRAELAYRTGELPTAQEVRAVLDQVAAL